MEQRYDAVKEVLEGAPVTEVALRYGVVRQTIHVWMRRYRETGIGGLANRNMRPQRCPHQMPPDIEERVVQLRIENSDWGPRRILWKLGREGSDLPSRSAIYRALVRRGLIDPAKRRRRREDYRRWERERAMELWQMDVMGRVRLADGTELSVVTGIDDHSRFCVIAKLVRRATSEAVCRALTDGLSRHGVPESILTDNGKVFTGRFSTSKSLVRFDRICHENGIRHLLTAPYSPTTSGKIERLHKTMRREFFNKHVFETVEEAQAALDDWVNEYNSERPHQSIGDQPPSERFQRAQQFVMPTSEPGEPEQSTAPTSGNASQQRRPMGVLRWVDATGTIRVGRGKYRVGREFAGEGVEVLARGGLLEIFHSGILVATHRLKANHKGVRKTSAEGFRAPRQATAGTPVKRIADKWGAISFAGAAYRVGRMYARREVDSLVAGSVQIAIDGVVIRVHPARHDPAKEHGAFAVPNGRGHYKWKALNQKQAG